MNFTLRNIRYDLKGVDVTGAFTNNKFPTGEENVFIKEWIPHFFMNDVYFVVKIDDAFSLMNLGMKVDILRREGCRHISIVLPYLPYSRQDRYTVHGASFSLKVFARFLNSLNLETVYTVDAHSDVAGVIDNLVDLPIVDCVNNILSNFKDDWPVLLSPDAGATKKIYKVIEKCSDPGRISLYTCEKQRNLSTGEITGISVPNFSGKDKHADVLVIDDICDGGRTFIEIAKKLPHNVKKYLFVTHGVFSKNDVFSYYDKIITTNSMKPKFSLEENNHTINLDFKRRQER